MCTPTTIPREAQGKLRLHSRRVIDGIIRSQWSIVYNEPFRPTECAFFRGDRLTAFGCIKSISQAGLRWAALDHLASVRCLLLPRRRSGGSFVYQSEDHWRQRYPARGHRFHPSLRSTHRGSQPSHCGTALALSAPRDLPLHVLRPTHFAFRTRTRLTLISTSWTMSPLYGQSGAAGRWSNLLPCAKMREMRAVKEKKKK